MQSGRVAAPSGQPGISVTYHIAGNGQVRTLPMSKSDEHDRGRKLRLLTISQAQETDLGPEMGTRNASSSQELDAQSARAPRSFLSLGDPERVPGHTILTPWLSTVPLGPGGRVQGRGPSVSSPQRARLVLDIRFLMLT